MQTRQSFAGGRRSRLAVLIGLTAALACSSGGGSAASGTPRVRSGGSSLISSEEVTAATASITNAYELVERLRPQMLRPRGSTFSAQRPDGTQSGEQIPIVAFMDDTRLGDVGNLRNIPTSQVKEIRFISATDATQRWGTGFGSGAILVVTKK